MHEYKVLPIADLIPYANNSRTHSEEQINQVASSIKEWAIINDAFAVSSCGIVLSLPRQCKTKGGGYRTVPSKVLTQYEDKDGYKLVTCKGLSKNGQVRVHRLVAECFIGQCPDGHEVNHIDGAKTNNRVENLEYVTSKENSIHAVKIGLTSLGASHHNTKPVQIEKYGFGFVAFGSRQIQGLNLRPQSVNRVARGERASIHGWECNYV